MFELPEFITLSRQINTCLVGKIVQDASLGNSPHKFVWYNRTPKELAAGPKRSVKSLLTQDQLLPGIGNGLAQDILFKARLHPRHPLDTLDNDQQNALYNAIIDIIQQVIAQGGRSEEYDLFNHPGGYQRIMNKQAAGHPCPRCGQTVEKIQYLGGACYFCPGCQI
jgi:formamidopyrimidine-DNA glycosylase